MNFYIDLDREILNLENALEAHQERYIENIEKIDNKLEAISLQLDRTNSPVKKEIIMKQIDFYERESEKMDRAIEIVSNDLNEKMKKLKKMKSEREEMKKKEKEAVDYNIKKLREAINRGNTSEIFTMFNHIANALEIIRDEARQT